MALKKLFTKFSLALRRQTIVSERCFASKAIKEIIESAEEEPVFLDETDKEMEKKRNKSRLNTSHRNILLGRKPYNESMEWYHNTVKYKKRLLGRYGMEALEVPAGLAWPTPEEVENVKEYERVAFPFTIQERWQQIEEKHKKREDAIMAQQKEIESKMANMQDMIAEVKARVAKRALEIEAAKKKKERRLQEIRHQLSLKGHVTTEKVQEMLGKLEKEDKKKRKEAKMARMIERQKKLVLKDMSTESETNTAQKEVEGESPEKEEIK